MAAIFCDLCEREIEEVATEMRLAPAAAGAGVNGKPFLVVYSERAEVQVACTSCARWIEQAIQELRRSFRGGA
ncbi:MAG: hypothetical protein AB7F65_00380 [Dehalococcoidia bacterium]